MKFFQNDNFYEEKQEKIEKMKLINYAVIDQNGNKVVQYTYNAWGGN